MGLDLGTSRQAVSTLGGEWWVVVMRKASDSCRRAVKEAFRTVRGMSRRERQLLEKRVRCVVERLVVVVVVKRKRRGLKELFINPVSRYPKHRCIQGCFSRNLRARVGPSLRARDASNNN